MVLYDIQEGIDMIQIRNERNTDHNRVEEITREAFYNVYCPGCSEHYLVHTMRQHEDFIPELDFVLEFDGDVIGNIMYTKAKLIDADKNTKEILTFGPVSVLPKYQRKGYGKQLIEYSLEKAKSLGYDVIVIFGNPSNYVSRGFKSCRKYNVSLEDGTYPTAMMVKELNEGVLEGKNWIYCDSPVMHIDEKAAREFDDQLEKMEKRYQPSQEEFYILSHSVLK